MVHAQYDFSAFWFHVPMKSDQISHVISDSILHQLFIVRFLGSMEVKATESTDVIYETMRQILAARAIHNIFRMTESHLLVTCECLKWVKAFIHLKLRWTDPVLIQVTKKGLWVCQALLWGCNMNKPQTKILNFGAKPPIWSHWVFAWTNVTFCGPGLYYAIVLCLLKYSVC